MRSQKKLPETQNRDSSPLIYQKETKNTYYRPKNNNNNSNHMDRSESVRKNLSSLLDEVPVNKEFD